MKHSTLDILIPAPQSVISAEGRIALRSINSIFAVEEGKGAADELCRGFEWLRLPLRKVDAVSEAKICLKLQEGMGKEEWQVQIGEDKIAIAAGGSVGLRYAVTALLHLVRSGADRR